MSVSNLPAILTAATGLIAAIGGIIALFRHVNGPKHTP